MSSAFAFIADIGLITLGGALKRKEYLSGRYADAFAWLYMATATLKHHHANGQPAHSVPLVNWTMTQALYEIENALYGVLRNMPNRPAAWLAGLLMFPLGRSYSAPDDKLLDQVVDNLLDDKDGLRNHLAGNIFLPDASMAGLGMLEDAYQKVKAAAPARRKVQQAQRSGQLPRGGSQEDLFAAAVKASIISEPERKLIVASEVLRNEVIQVDYFAPKGLKG